jgi:SAM-dependent methyltransferase
MLNMSKDAIMFACWHRTGYRKSSSKQQQFSDDMENEIQRITPVLPEKVDVVLDIGCGLGGIDVMLYRHYQGNVDLCLIDKTEVTGKITYRGGREFYNSMSVTHQFMVSNGVDPSRIIMQEATEDNRILFDRKFDIIISLISWGFHYPLDTYLLEVEQKLASPGILIIDTNASNADILREVFGNCELLIPDWYRWVVRR